MVCLSQDRRRLLRYLEADEARGLRCGVGVEGPPAGGDRLVALRCGEILSGLNSRQRRPDDAACRDEILYTFVPSRKRIARCKRAANTGRIQPANRCYERRKRRWDAAPRSESSLEVKAGTSCTKVNLIWQVIRVGICADEARSVP